MGQTNYEKISSAQGPCFYPGGHLWHYRFIYQLFQWTDNAEYILIALHFALYSATIALISKLSYQYFKQDVMQAQMVSFMLVSNCFVRLLQEMCFNDSILAFYLVASIYQMTNQRPLTSALLAGLSFSIKAGSILIVPGLLGWTHYQYGPIVLAKSILLIGFLHFAMALPFVSVWGSRLYAWSVNPNLVF